MTPLIISFIILTIFAVLLIRGLIQDEDWAWHILILLFAGAILFSGLYVVLYFSGNLHN